MTGSRCRARFGAQRRPATATRPEQLKDDFYAWTRDQARALRRLAAERCNGPLDLEHLAEAVEGLGSEQQWAVESRLERVLEHLLKLEHSANPEFRRLWMISVVDARGEVERRMRPCSRSPGREGRRRCRRIVPNAFDDLVADEWWPANRHGLRDDD